MIPDGVFQTAQKFYQNELQRMSRRHRDEQALNQYRYKKMMTLGTVIGVGFVAVGINGYMKYNSLLEENVGLRTENTALSETATMLNNETQTLSQQNQELQQVAKKQSIFAGVSEVAAGALWFALEPISGTMVIIDGIQRIWMGGSDTPK